MTDDELLPPPDPPPDPRLDISIFRNWPHPPPVRVTNGRCDLCGYIYDEEERP
jgi:hypothetical protein